LDGVKIRGIKVDKKYQVFVSSTYDDLRRERQAVMQSLLELDCIPSGMELFPAADESQWTLIKGVIDECDYYIIIVAGRYGSIGNNGQSYTEMEYRYALEKGKPILGFLHRNPSNIPVGKTDKEQVNREKLEEFRKLVKKKMCRDWETPEELGGVVTMSLVRLKKDHAAIGWVSGSYARTPEDAENLSRLQGKVTQLEDENDTLRSTINQYNKKSQQKGQPSFANRPRIAIDFSGFLKGFQLEIEIAENAYKLGVRAGELPGILQITQEKLKSYVIELDDFKHRQLAESLKKAMVDIRVIFAALEQHGTRDLRFLTTDQWTDIWNQEAALMKNLKMIEFQLKTESWE
jgi:hypothetical protein